MARFRKLFSLLLLCFTLYPADVFTVTSSVSNDVMLYLTNVSASVTCNTCNSTCPTRTDFPSYRRLFDTAADNCLSFNTNSITNGNINKSSTFVVFNNSSNESCFDVNFTESTSNSNFFTLTFWINSNISGNSHLVSVGNVQLTISGDNLLISPPVNVAQPALRKDSWTFIAILYNGVLSVFSSTAAKTVFNWNMTPFANYSVTIGPKQSLPMGESLTIGDVRWYPDGLTDRELKYLSNGTFTSLYPDSECRCPPDTPLLEESTVPFPGLRCTNYLRNVSKSRLNSNAHFPLYVADNNNATYWSSGNVNNVSLKIELSKMYQINQISIVGLNNTPAIEMIEISLEFNNRPTVLKFESSCTESSCKNIASHVTGGSFVHSFAENGSTRLEYEKLLASNLALRIKAKGTAEFKITEMIIGARCPCYGHDTACAISKGTYTCNCGGTGAMYNGSYCSDCADEYFREQDSLNCTGCECNSNGRKNNVCDKVGGQCVCKLNVMGKKCDTCKHNFANLGFDSTTGCQGCGCNLYGMISCLPSLSCICKNNTESSTGKCNTCKDEFYNITRPEGCIECSCNLFGSTSRICNMTTGLCPCLPNVQGRTCDSCKDTYFDLSAACNRSCDCSGAGSTNMVCDKSSGQCNCISSSQSNRQCIPVINSTSPEFGPRAGGTVVTITGALFSNPSITPTILIGLVDQDFINRSDDTIVFKTKPSTQNGSRDISIRWSSDETTDKRGAKFEYRPDTTLTVSSSIMAYASGGCHVGFPGTFLDSVQSPRLVVYLNNGNKIESECKPNDTKCPMKENTLCCKTPNMSSVTTETRLKFGFKLDGIATYTNISDYEFVAYRDPVVNVNIKIKRKNTFDDGVIEITGDGLNSACNEPDVKITVGDKMCAIASRSDTKITCKFSEKFPGKSRTEEIKVTIGYFTHVFGTVEFVSFWNTLEFYLILGGALAFILFIVVVFCCCYWRRRKRNEVQSGFLESESYETRKRNGNEYVRMTPPAAIETAPLSVILSSASRTVPSTATTTSFNAPTTPADKPSNKDAFCYRLDKPDAKLIESSVVLRENVELSKNPICTRKGQLSRVIDGQFSDSASRSSVGRNLTIKVLKDRYPESGSIPEWLVKELRECTRFRDQYNDHVLRMMGIAIDATKVYILYEEMENRTLKEYMIKETKNKVLPSVDLMELCAQVADGMEYLSSISVVHKDLACRNCWVDKNRLVKIADCSFSADLFPEEYMTENGSAVPVRWMAPECLKQGFYDSKSDVWSFGVLMWEVFTDCEYLPFYDIQDDKDVKQKVCFEDYKLVSPECGECVANLMQDCFATLSKDRPSFRVIINRLTNTISPGAMNVNVSYVNKDAKLGYVNKGVTSDVAEEEDYANQRFAKDLKGETKKLADDSEEDYMNTMFGKRH